MVAMGNVNGSGVWPTSFGHTPLPYRYVLLNCFAIALRSLSFLIGLDQASPRYFAIICDCICCALGGVHVMASAPASMVARMRSSDPPPDARIGISG